MERRRCTAPTAPSAQVDAEHSGGTDIAENRHHCLHSQDAGGWVRSLAVATFDVGTGHTLEQVQSYMALKFHHSQSSSRQANYSFCVLLKTSSPILYYLLMLGGAVEVL